MPAQRSREFDSSREGRNPRDVAFLDTIPADRLTTLADSFTRSGDFGRAERHLRQFLELCRTSTTIRIADQVETVLKLADLLTRRGNRRDAITILRQAIRLPLDDTPDQERLGARIRRRLASLLVQYGSEDDLREAEVLYREAIRVLERITTESHPDLIEALHGLAEVLIRREQHSDGNELLKRAWQLASGSLPSVQAGEILATWAAFCERQGNWEQAEHLWYDCVRIRDQVCHDLDPRRLQGRLKLAAIVLQRSPAKAEPHFRAALQHARKHLGIDHPSIATVAHALAVCLRKRGERLEAEQLLRQALTIRQRVYGPNHPDTKAVFRDLAALLP